MVWQNWLAKIQKRKPGGAGVKSARRSSAWDGMSSRSRACIYVNLSQDFAKLTKMQSSFAKPLDRSFVDFLQKQECKAHLQNRWSCSKWSDTYRPSWSCTPLYSLHTCRLSDQESKKEIFERLLVIHTGKVLMVVNFSLSSIIIVKNKTKTGQTWCVSVCVYAN
jgi:hypothetical protein